ncbi:MAG: UDP-N-acetylmuramoyl-tripeptide--D-alanyl-D-alanine ligase [Syntrophomonadaceae bacterium]
MRLSLKYIVESAKGVLLCGDVNSWIEGVSTDSRHYAPGQVFFALKGDKFDGHDYVNDLIKSGATAVVVSRPDKATLGTDSAVILVGDTLEALQSLAASYRSQFDIPIVAVTGSVGKTTTKDILAACLSPVFVTLKTPGNFNNEIGLPLTLLDCEASHQAAVVELAMRASGEITRLASILRPTHAIITNVEPVHLETMGSLENIASAKCEVLEFIPRDKFALINGDNHYLVDAARKYPCVKHTFGYNDDCDVQIIQIERAGPGIMVSLGLWGQIHDFSFPLPAPQLVANLAAAVGCAFLLGVSPAMIDQGLKSYRTAENRLNIIDLPEGGAVIDDTYNANPVSMTAAIEICREISGIRRAVAILGDMLELGDYEIEGHLLVGRRAAELNMDLVVTIGEKAAYIAQGAIEAGLPAQRVMSFKQRDRALEWLKLNVSRRDVVLFKGSRGMRLEEILQGWLIPA